ncbi:hypothetical protein NAEGRDRAFT_80571 [Naegleria gruberi]|uniref:MINDY deubiquitinase domain-containing protein n=1 Tax=Naegleria gruberi TaxID=5762 RepID=D2VMR4_NAEGR|nr:uncharacterized protein NAEGRDRAFT_80571 [Naegleria gruberi]EFC41876.1 hypothetical protein NAEGRDRAFT_80571 [Naegleria gruberi]|eukprot:XP_002674620.1 hypothetical protein NAEGRDRAFT_80571 [Naegleria gruberi strain NEG-M]
MDDHTNNQEEQQQQSEEATFVNMEEGDTIQLAAKDVDEEGTIEKYRVKRVLIGERRTPIVLQNLNGPCPLIAVFNIISLRGGDVSAIDNFIVNGFITNESLVQILAQSMLDTYNLKYSKSDTDGEKGKMLQAALDSVPKLKHGLDVNVQFTEGVHGFTTCDLSVFNFFNIKLMHGWLVDSESELETFKALKSLSYDQAVEKIVLMNELINAEEQMKKSGKVIEQILSAHVDLTELKTPEEMVTRLPVDQKNDIISQGSLIQTFLTNSPSQLTQYGLASLHNSLADRKIAIFFRNNHFSVICKIQEAILTLCTNETLLNETNIVWENLTIHGEDQQYYLGDFTPFRMLETHSQNYEYYQQEKAPVVDSKQHDEDLQLALQLQREEEMAYQQEMMHEQQQQTRQPQAHPHPQQQQQFNPQFQQPQQQANNPQTSPRVVQTPLEQDPSIPYANVPTIREKKPGSNTTKKHGANAYANQASQLRELNKQRQERELASPQVSQSSKKTKKESDCIIC